MRADPLRAAAWTVVILASFLFVAEVRRIAVAPPVPLPGPESESTTRQPAPAPSKPMKFVGNTNTHKFHVTTCKYAGCPNCTARFATREEAIEAGYRPGGCCRP